MVPQTREENATAPAAAPQPNSAEPLQVVSFRVGGQEFGLDILRVLEIIRPRPLTRVPDAPDHVDGVIHLRGRVVPVIALWKRFGFGPPPREHTGRIVVLEVRGIVVGLLADSVPEVLRIPAGAMMTAPRLQQSESEYVVALAKFQDRLLVLVDVDRIVGMPIVPA